MFIIGVCVALVLVLVVMINRHQRTHCSHLRELSNAVTALATFIGDRVPGELPAEVRSFVEEWSAHEDHAEDPPAERL
jgi:hypothetical protein